MEDPLKMLTFYISERKEGGKKEKKKEVEEKEGRDRGRNFS